MEIVIEVDGTRMVFTINPEWNLSPEGAAEAPHKIYAALHPLLSSLTSIIHAGIESPEQLAVTIAFLQALLATEIPRLEGYMERLLAGEPVEDLVVEILFVNSTKSSTAFDDEINKLDLD